MSRHTMNINNNTSAIVISSLLPVITSGLILYRHRQYHARTLSHHSSLVIFNAVHRRQLPGHMVIVRPLMASRQFTPGYAYEPASE